jgi:uncharacterized protein (DUF488 family)
LKTIHTIGHSNRPVGEFTGLLGAAGIALLADVRAYPVSRRHPHFSREPLAGALKAAGIDYLWLGAALGGHRSARADSVNTALPPAWRGYADHMQTSPYAAGLTAIEQHALNRPTAIMCAERNPSDCHRNLISDNLVARSWCVMHIIGANEPLQHTQNPAARWVDGVLSYPGHQQLQLGLG